MNGGFEIVVGQVWVENGLIRGSLAALHDAVLDYLCATLNEFMLVWSMNRRHE